MYIQYCTCTGKWYIHVTYVLYMCMYNYVINVFGKSSFLCHGLVSVVYCGKVYQSS